MKPLHVIVLSILVGVGFFVTYALRGDVLPGIVGGILAAFASGWLAFRWLLADTRSRGLPLILETPQKLPEIDDGRIGLAGFSNGMWSAPMIAARHGAAFLSSVSPLRLAPAFAFAGRADELAMLKALLPRTAAEGRRAAPVAGEAGSGKGRLVRELAHEVASEGATVLYELTLDSGSRLACRRAPA